MVFVLSRLCLDFECTVYGRGIRHGVEHIGRHCSQTVAMQSNAYLSHFMQDGWTALHLAAWNGHVQVMQILLDDVRVVPGERNKVRVCSWMSRVLRTARTLRVVSFLCARITTAVFP